MKRLTFLFGMLERRPLIHRYIYGLMIYSCCSAMVVELHYLPEPQYEWLRQAAARGK
jgi:hypothetical protein